MVVLNAGDTKGFLKIMQTTETATPITVATGDGIGPEIMTATLAVLKAAGARLAPEFIEIGQAVYERGATSGIEPCAWESLRRTGVFLKAPITTPQGAASKALMSPFAKHWVCMPMCAPASLMPRSCRHAIPP